MSKTIVRYIGNNPKMAGMEGELTAGQELGSDQFSLVAVQWKHSFGVTEEPTWTLRKLRGYSKAFR